MNRITERLRSTDAPVTNRCHTGALLPYLTAGFPDLATTEALIRRADSIGAAVIELGFPFSDSIADGPVIQDSFNTVLERGQTVAEIFRMVSEVRPGVNCGLVAMVSHSIVLRHGVDRFMERAAASGFDGVILPDVPVEESAPTKAAAQRVGLCYIGLVAPTTSPARREAIARSSSGFVYQIAVAGTTGERTSLPPGLPDDVARLRQVSGLPVCVGFGIATAEQVRRVCEFADGAIVGSAVVRRIADAVQEGLSRDALIETVTRFISELAGVTND